MSSVQKSARPTLRRVVQIFLCLLLLVSSPAVAHDWDPLLMTPTECSESEFYASYLRTKMSWQCATLSTSENPDGSGRGLNIAVAILNPLDKSKALRTPTVVVHGGPGVGIVRDWWSFGSYALLEDGPLILFDQRGVGQSTPRLCPELDDDNPELDIASAAQLFRHLDEGFERCVETLQADGFNLSAYGTQATVRDMETLRKALKIERWNVFGTSYGTAVSLAYIAQHPTRIKAAVLDSLYPPEMNGFTTMLPDFVRSFEAMMRLCATNARCATRFPDLSASLRNSIRSLDRHPLTVDTIDSNFSVTRRRISGSTLMAIIHAKLMFAPEWHHIPLLISDAEKRSPSKRLARAAGRWIEETLELSNAVYLATECSERAPFEDKTELKRQIAKWPEFAAALGTESSLSLCERWPVKREQWQTPRGSGVPSLLIAGEWDPVTPPEQAERTAALLGDRAHYVLIPRIAHAPTWSDPCATEIMREFLRHPEKRPATLCAQQSRAPILATRLIDIDTTTEPVPLYTLLLIFALVLSSAIIWPIAWLQGRFAGEFNTIHFTKRSGFWLTVSAVATLVALYPLVKIAYSNDFQSLTWMYDGIPAEAWPEFLLLPISVGFAGTAGWFFLHEIRNGVGSILQLLHRGLVFASLIAVAMYLWRCGLLSELPWHIFDEIELQTLLHFGTIPASLP
jgi:pimeloyl-ACP methyl ester carboxylesterase